uniref:Uncharacterized protein n=1 Tax=Anguilla anguilla TaxID=7936 RepID=A0A0E9QSF1_ANGAN
MKYSPSHHQHQQKKHTHNNTTGSQLKANNSSLTPCSK